MKRFHDLFAPVLVMLAVCSSTAAQQADDERMYDLSTQKVLYCIGYAHLDTQWRWDFPTTIDRFIRATLDDNFDRFENYPGYVFNFTGSVRYQMMKEYYPQRYQRLKQFVASGRWHVSGSSVDEGDANVPAPESIIRHVLYGNNFFRREFDRESVDFMLPDCFGFPASMPSIWAHCGLRGFSTQKLTWGSAVGIPFKIGVWEGPDGNGVVAAFDPGPYSTAIKGRVDTNEQWVERVNHNGEQYGVWADYHYYGVGDTGGAPRAEDVANYLASIDNPDSQFHVALTSSDQMYKDLTDEQIANLPRYRGDLLLTEHSAGTLTSQSYMKRWNRKGEQLADAAERAAVAASWLGGMNYPNAHLERSWVRLLANQMHDILPGTSIPRAYTYSWNDEILALNGFAGVVEDGVSAVASQLETNVHGTPIVVYNPLAIERADLAEATVPFDGAVPAALRVYGPDGREVPSQELHRDAASITVLFEAEVEPVSWTVFDVRRATDPYSDDANTLRIDDRTIRNEHYVITLNDAGDVASIIDRSNGNRELLEEPARLVFTHEKPQHYPAWNMDWNDRRNPPVGAVDGKPTFRIVENGPLRVSLEVEREARNSIVTQRLQLARGDAGRVATFDTTIDWQSTECALKASFPLTVHNFDATYNWGLGAIQRGNNDPTKYEVPSHEWFDLTSEDGSHGVSILEDSKFGSDKPADNELRLTLLYTPGVRQSFMDQHSQDWGRHDIVYALYSHEGDWRKAGSPWRGRRLNQPLRTFVADQHGGALGRAMSFASLSTSQVDVRALKRAERSDMIIVRLQELWGESADHVSLQFAAPIIEAYEVDGQERRIGDAKTANGALVVNMTPYSPRSFAIRLADAPVKAAAARCTPVALPYNADVLSRDDDRSDGAMDDAGRTIPGEQLPPRITCGGVAFLLGSSDAGRDNAVACSGQTIELPGDSRLFDRVYILAAATDDVNATFAVGDTRQNRTIQKWTGFIGQWDNRVWDRPFDEIDFRGDGHVVGIETGYIKRERVAWFCTHHHDAQTGNVPYRFSYLFRYALDVPQGADSITLPNDPRVKILAMTSVQHPIDGAQPAAPLYDNFTDRKPIEFRFEYPPPPKPVFEGVLPTGEADVDRAESFEALRMGPPSASDFVDQHAGHDLEFRYYAGNGDYRPHPGSGARHGAFPRLNDGVVAQNHDDTTRCVWYDNEGRFYIDLGAPLPIDRIKTYSWHRSNRAPQYFSLWGARGDVGDSMPSPAITNDAHDGWELIAVVDSRELGNGAKHGSSVFGRNGALGPYRWLLWIAEDVGQGTFFTEIDVYAANEVDHDE